MTQKIENVSMQRLICNCKSWGNVANSPKLDTNTDMANKGMTIQWELCKYLPLELPPIGIYQPFGSRQNSVRFKRLTQEIKSYERNISSNLGCFNSIRSWGEIEEKMRILENIWTMLERKKIVICRFYQSLLEKL